MNRILEEKLKSDFPYIFVDMWKKGSCLEHGIVCEDGWYDLIYNLCETIKQINPGETFKAVQVKQKFDSLRFYFSGVEDDQKSKQIYSLIKEAARKSANLCEVCSMPTVKKLDNMFCLNCKKSTNPYLSYP